MYDNIDIDDKVKYLNEVGYNIMTQQDMVDYIVGEINDIGGLRWAKSVLEDLDLEYDYYELGGNYYPITVENDYIDDEFEDSIDEICEKTNIKNKYPNVFENIEL